MFSGVAHWDRIGKCNWTVGPHIERAVDGIAFPKTHACHTHTHTATHNNQRPCGIYCVIAYYCGAYIMQIDREPSGDWNVPFCVGIFKLTRASALLWQIGSTCECGTGNFQMAIALLYSFHIAKAIKLSSSYQIPNPFTHSHSAFPTCIAKHIYTRCGCPKFALI